MYQKFKTNILVRDKMIERMKNDGIIVDYKQLSGQEYINALRNKVIEEAEEVAYEYDREKLVYELADLIEVLETLADYTGITKSEVLDAKNKKRELSGGFSSGNFTNFVEIDTENPVIEYYQQRQNKYPRMS